MLGNLKEPPSQTLVFQRITARNNPLRFGTKDKEKYTKDILERLKYYDTATDQHLVIQLQIEQEIIKWTHR